MAVVHSTRGVKTTMTLEGGPALVAAMARLDDKLRVVVAKDALRAAGEEIRIEWASRVPIEEGNYREALLQDSAVKVAKAKLGAVGSVAPRMLPGLPENEQPVLYAPRLEFGDRSRAAQPSARPAFDSSATKAADAAGAVIRKAVE